MAFILALETATKNCSVALFNKSSLIAHKQKVSEDYSHAEQLTPFIQEVLFESQIEFRSLSAIAVSTGPGSYTGLRIGTSVAKGLCYALDIPLIAVPTLKAMAYSVSKNHKVNLYCPMIDARRMEVYSAFYNKKNQEIRSVQADIIDKDSYQSFLQEEVLFFGDGSYKCQELIKDKNAIFLDGVLPSANNMGKLAFEAFHQEKFEDVAYFEPFYLKDFVSVKKV